MAIRKIIQLGDPRLRKVSKEVLDFGDKTQVLIDDMIDTLNSTDNGIGLSAVQIGILKRIFIIDMRDGKGVKVFVNPKIVEAKGARVGEEGCLSIVGRSGYVERPNKLIIEAQDRFGVPFRMKAKDLYAVCICHESDHLDGVLFIDKMIEEIR